MECPKCKSEIRDDSLFCRFCGMRLDRPERVGETETQAVLHPSRDLMIGSTFLDRYRILEELGRGGMGVVYRAEDTKLKRNVALKFLPPGFTRDPVAKDRFIQEAQAASALDHPGICTIHEIDETRDSQIFISMACYEGETLKDLIQQGPLEVARAIDIAIQVAEGLEEAHEKGIFHRDIKPGNIMITAKGQVKIMDFGLAKLAGQTRITKTGTTVGTAAYMSPEQARGEDIDHRTDIWSLGVVLYEMLSGQRPFRGEYDQAVIYSILREDFKALSDIRPEVPREAETVVTGCLRKDPDQRYQTAGELIADLKRLRRGSSALRYSPPRTASLSRGRFGRSDAVRIGLPIAAAALAVAMFWLIPGGRESLKNLVGLRDSGPALTRVAVLPCRMEGADPGDQALCDGLIRKLTADLRAAQVSDASVWVLPAGKLYPPDLANPTDVSRWFGIDVTVGSDMQRVGDLLELTFTRNDVAVETPDDASAEIVRRRRSPTLSDPLANLSTWQDSALFYIADLLGMGIDLATLADLKSRSTTVPGAYAAFLRGMGYYYPFWGKDSLDAAVDAFGEAIGQDSTFAMAHVWLARAYLSKFLETGDQAMVDLALASVGKALEMDTEFASANWVNGEIHRYSGRYGEAIDIYNSILDMGGADLWTLLSKGKAYRSMDSLEAAAAAFAEATEVEPWYADTYHHLGYVHLMRGRYDEAIEPFRKLVELEPLNLTGYTNLGVTLFELGRWEEARGVFEEALTIDSTAFVCSNLGTIYFAEARYVDAARMYAKALEISGNDYLVCGNLAECYFWIPGQREEALEYYHRAIDLAEEELEASPDDAMVLSSLASYCERLGDHEKSRAWLARAAELGSSDPRVLFQIAETYEQLGDRENALEWVGRALDSADPAVKAERYRGLRSLRLDPRYKEMLREREMET